MFVIYCLKLLIKYAKLIFIRINILILLITVYNKAKIYIIYENINIEK